MTLLKLVLKQEVITTRELLLLAVLGRFENRLPKDVEQELREWVNEEALERKSLEDKIRKLSKAI